MISSRSVASQQTFANICGRGVYQRLDLDAKKSDKRPRRARRAGEVLARLFANIRNLELVSTIEHAFFDITIADNQSFSSRSVYQSLSSHTRPGVTTLSAVAGTPAQRHHA